MITLNTTNVVTDGNDSYAIYKTDYYGIGVKRSGGKVITITISPKTNTDIVIPDIHYDSIKAAFEIQTTSYGAVSKSTIKEMIAGYQIAVETVELLERNFC